MISDAEIKETCLLIKVGRDQKGLGNISASKVKSSPLVKKYSFKRKPE